METDGADRLFFRFFCLVKEVSPSDGSVMIGGSFSTTQRALE